MDVSRRVVAGALLYLCSAACGDAEPSGPYMSAGGRGGAGAGKAGHAGETAGAGSGGEVSGDGSGGSPSAAGAAVGGGAGAGANVGGGGSSGAGSMAGGGPPACNSLELLEVGSVCSTMVSGLEPLGGTLVDGLYALVEYELTACSFQLEQTLRLQMTEENTYHMDTVVNVDNFHSSGTFVMNGVMLHSTLDCGGTEVNKPYGYSVSEVEGEQYFTLFVGGIYTYHRVGD